MQITSPDTLEKRGYTGLMTVLTFIVAGINMAAKKEKDSFIAHVVLMSQQKCKNSG